MNIQIGMSCNPTWLCLSLSWVIAAIAIVGLVALVRAVRREMKAQKKRHH